MEIVCVLDALSIRESITIIAPTTTIATNNPSGLQLAAAAAVAVAVAASSPVVSTKHTGLLRQYANILNPKNSAPVLAYVSPLTNLPIVGS